MEKEKLNLSKIRERLANKQGKIYWRSLEELANTQEFQKFIESEFPSGLSEWKDSISRRNFLKLMGAGMAMAGLTACASQPPEKIVPYVNAPEQVVPGEPLFFASAHVMGGYASGVLVESHMGRPTKLEGNPDHPASLGATDLFAQASILTMYDPDRAQMVSEKAKGAVKSDWDSFVNALTAQLETIGDGAGLRILAETITSPSLAAQMQELRSKFPKITCHQYEPVNRDNVREGARIAFGEDAETQYHLDKAKVVLALDANFLVDMPGSLRYARDFMDGRRVANSEHNPEMNRLYAIESALSGTGATADHRLAMRSSDIEGFARAVAQKLELPVDGATSEHQDWVDAIAEDLQNAGSGALVIPGDNQPPAVHALAHAINNALGSQAVSYTDPVVMRSFNQVESLKNLVEAMNSGQVDTLIILGGNPAFNAPADINFAEALNKVPFSVYLGLYENETAKNCAWRIPQSHALEAWSDARAYDGTVTIMQPLIMPLYQSKTASELLAALTGQADANSHDLVRDYWAGTLDDKAWQTALHDGIVPNTALPAKSISIDAGALAVAPNKAPDGLEISFRPDPTIWDGRYANNGWLQEMAKPINKLTWDNAAIVSPAAAEELGLTNEDLITLNYRGQSVDAPVLVVPGHANNSITVYLGYGRSAAGRVGTDVGFNAYAIRPSAAPWFGGGVEISKTGKRYMLAHTQTHHNMEGRNLARSGSLEEFKANPRFVHEEEEGERQSMYPEFEYKGYAWGMSIDIGACTGCNACVMACYAENNIPIVGKEEVANGREMNWIRIDHYFEGGLDNPTSIHQPVMCQHCAGAPCEVVCPAGATLHSREGLSDMVYNRCIGTRYCMNNCPYKVRRFNFLEYTDYNHVSLELMRNPDVTVRSRGVVEKCSFCVQRINLARISAKKEDRQIRDGEIQTACQQACPTNAIVFGNIADEDSQVSKLKESPLDYELLGELNIQPRATYLARVKNLNPKLQTEGASDERHG